MRRTVLAYQGRAAILVNRILIGARHVRSLGTALAAWRWCG